MNRNRVLHPSDGWQYLSVPLSNSSIHIKVKDALIKSRKKTVQSLVRRLEHYRKRAPFFQECVNVFETAFNSVQDDRLVSLNVACLASVCRYLAIPFNYRLASELDLAIPNSLPPGQWAPKIAAHLGADTYINPIGGKDMFDLLDFSNVGVSLSFLKHGELTYDCADYTFQSSLSIIDTMMWMPPNVLSDAIQGRYQLVKKP